jgi:hypothetical protein
MTALAFAVESPLRYLIVQAFDDSFPDSAALDGSVTWILIQSLFTIPALVLGGFVAAWLAPCCKFAHAIAMAVVQELLLSLR